MPQEAGRDWKVLAEQTGRAVRLFVRGSGAIKSPYFFSENAFIDYEPPQTSATRAGGQLLSLPVAEEAQGATQRLQGVLAYTDTQGIYRGIRIDAPLTSGGIDAETGGLGAALPGSGRSLSMRLLALALLGGLILNLMPCVFPVLGIKVLGFVNAAGSDSRKVVRHGLAFSLGVLISFWVLAGLLTALRAGGQQLGWGFSCSPHLL
jgi:thiol:disulfide interchange protein DsbD